MMDRLFASGWQLDRVSPAIHRCEPNWRWNPPAFQDFDLWCVLDGFGRVSVDGMATAAEPGAIFLLQPGQGIQASHDPKRRLTVFACHFVFLDAKGRESIPRGLPGRWMCPDLPMAESLAGWACRYNRNPDPPAVRAVHLALTQLLLTAALPPSAETLNEGIGRVVAAVEREPGADWTISQMAALASLSRSHFSRRFSELTGTSPNRFVIRCRIHRACELLRQTNLTVSEVASGLGYSDVYFFSRQFRSVTGSCATEYRKRHALSSPSAFGGLLHACRRQESSVT